MLLMLAIIPGKAEISYSYDESNFTASAHNIVGDVTIPEYVYHPVLNRETNQYESKKFRVTSINGYNTDAGKVDASHIVRIEDMAFLQSKLKSITFGDDLEYIGGSAFSDCKNLTIGIRFPKNLKIIDRDAFRRSAVAWLDFSAAKSLEIIEERAFWHCGEKIFNEKYVTIGYKGVESIKFPEGECNLKTIGNGAFLNCYNLNRGNKAAMTMPASLVTIGDGAFIETGIQSFNFNNVVNVGESVLGNCEDLTNVTMKNCISLPKQMFFGCKKLSKLQLSDEITEIGENAFALCESLPEKFILPKKCSLIKSYAFPDCSAKFIYYQGNTPPLVLKGGIGGMQHLEKYGKEKVSFSGTSRTVGLDAGGKIAAYTFSDCHNLKYMPDDFESCESGAFYGCSGLEGLNFPKTAKTVNESFITAFLDKIFGSREEWTLIRNEISDKFNEEMENNRQGRFLASRGIYMGSYSIGSSSFVKLEKSAFSSVGFHEVVERIEAGCLNGFSALDSLTFGREGMVQPQTQVLVIDEDAFATNTKVSKVVTYHAVPPTMADKAFPSTVYNSALLIVPDGSEEAYRKAEGWKRFRNISSPSMSGIADGVAADSDEAPVEYFNLQGVRMQETDLTPGVYIRRQGSRSEKVILR